ncbi:putative porin [Flavobacterium granuli]|uniref:Beta-barrel porin n=1 Tax=Flavobacterium granuli TaxID=280093 RepID=A0A1M5QNT0_9FLAO|nr:putative porin [Flavobacterium granuli]PRZ25234.1 putative beta-barrel porin [Flavobacterium granuli]SHH15767.1 Putative porin [Flavobacterium granuli]
MRILFFLYFLIVPTVLFSQIRSKENTNKIKSLRGDSESIKEQKAKEQATIDQYRFITLDRDTTYIDTSLTIQKEYSHNYLRKDNFGLLAFPNEGQTYNTLQYSLTKFSPYPEIGFKAKHFNFLEANQIRYSSVATPVTELYFKSVMEKGQSLDAFFTLNITPRLNFSIAYKGLRSTGRYINQLASTGNFRFTTSYNTLNERYFANAHYTYQDILNEENGGITTISDFENEDSKYDNRQRLEVYLTDAKSFLKGKRIFLDHFFRINTTKGANNLYVAHQFNYENKFFEYNQETVPSTVGAATVFRFGDSYVTSGINDQTRYNKMYNKAGLTYENTTLGKFHFFVDDFRSNYYYNQILIRDDKTIPASLSRNINSAGGQYEYQKNSWKGNFLYSRSITNQSLSNLDANLQYDLNEDYQFSFKYQNLNKLPNDNYNLYQSSYIGYNWSNDFRNEKINTIVANASTPWIEASVQLMTLRDHLYFENTAIYNEEQIITPNQYGKTINYVSVKVAKEFKFGNFALNNTLLYQKTDQMDAILNVPEIVTRNTIYYTNYMFKKALFLQTGVTLNYFTKYMANDYNPVIGEFFIQNKKEIGNYPNLDFFINAKIQRTRIYLKAEHFNSSFSGNNFYSAPNMPYRDFMIRFGLIWNFFN